MLEDYFHSAAHDTKKQNDRMRVITCVVFLFVALQAGW